MVEYADDEQGGPQPVEIPRTAPCGAEGQGSCCTRRHSVRERKTSPGHPLVVMVCKTHKRYFTLYPLGHMPYGRTPVLEVTAEGRPRSQALSPASLRETLFAAAVDASESATLWPRDSEHGRPSLRTQRRQVKRAAMWLGLDAPTRPAEQMAHILDVDLLLHAQVHARYRAASTTRSRATCVVDLLAALSVDGMLLIRLLRAGHLAGVCPEAWWWVPGAGYGYPSFRSPRRSLPASVFGGRPGVNDLARS